MVATDALASHASLSAQAFSSKPTSATPSVTASGRLINLPSFASAANACASVITGSLVLKSPSRYEPPAMLNIFLTGTPASFCAASSCALVGGSLTISTEVNGIFFAFSQASAFLQVEQFGYW